MKLLINNVSGKYNVIFTNKNKFHFKSKKNLFFFKHEMRKTKYRKKMVHVYF